MIELKFEIQNEHYKEAFTIMQLYLKPGDKIIVSHQEESA